MNPQREPEHPITPFDEANDLQDPGTTEESGSSSRSWRGMSLKPVLLIIAVVLSPVFGLVFGLDFALGVLAVALTFTTWMAWEGAKDMEPEQGDRVRKAAMLNGALAVLAVVLIVVRQVV